MNILITGSDSYLGKSLSQFLLRQGHNIGYFNRNSYSEFIYNFNPDIVIHTICCYGRNNESHKEIYDSNLITGINIINDIRLLEKSVTFINAGTSLNKDTNLYSLSKNQFKEYGKHISNDKFKFINMNLQHFFGAGAKNNFISFLINKFLQNEPVPLTNGLQKRDFIYIEDVIFAFDAVIQNKDILYNYEDIDVGSGVTTSIKEIVELVHNLCDSSSDLQFGKIIDNNTDTEMKANTAKLESLNWKCNIDLETGLKYTLENHNGK